MFVLCTFDAVGVERSLSQCHQYWFVEFDWSFEILPRIYWYNFLFNLPSFRNQPQSCRNVWFWSLSLRSSLVLVWGGSSLGIEIYETSLRHCNSLLVSGRTDNHLPGSRWWTHPCGSSPAHSWPDNLFLEILLAIELGLFKGTFNRPVLLVTFLTFCCQPGWGPHHGPREELI